MGKLDENYFKPTENDSKYQSVKDILEPDEQLLWEGKPKKQAFLLNSFFRMFPIALIWLIFDATFIGIIIPVSKSLSPFILIFIIVFFAFHLFPVWMWISNVLTANRQHKNIEYAFTNKRIIVKSGVIGIDFKNIYYSEINSVNLRVGIIDQIMHVGDIYIKSFENATVLYDLENPYFITQKLQKIVVDIKTDISFPNNLRPDENNGYNTKYRP